MPGLRDGASRHPVAFALLATLGLILLYAVAAIVAQAAAAGDVSHQVTESIARLTAAALVILVVARLGLLGDSGVVGAGSGWVWLLAVVASVYRILTHSYGFFGELGLSFSASPLACAVAFNGAAAALLEEVTFRGAVLAVVLRSWRLLPGGVLRAVWVTAFVFGASHVIRIAMGRPAPVVDMLMLDATLAGVFYAALVIRGKSVWPAVLVHLAINAYVGARAVSIAEFAETVSGWVPILLSSVPLLVVGLWLLRGRVKSAACAS